MDEIWKDISGYEGIYQVSNMGNVRSLDRLDNRGRITHGRELAHKRDGGNYHQVALCKDGKQIYRHIHRLVCEAFLPNPDNKPTVNHIDENKDNNRLDNLEWATYKENAHHGTRMARCYGHRDYRAIGRKIAEGYRRNGRCRKVMQCDITGRPVREFEAIVDASETLETTPTAIRYAVDHQTVFKGYRWKFAEVS